MSFNSQLLEKEKKLSPEELLRRNRWSDGIICPECLSTHTTKNGMRSDGIQQYSCKKCRISFNDRTNTIFSKTQMSIGECLKITSNYKDGQSISEISNRVNRSWKTVNDFIKQLNQSLASDMLLDMAENTKETQMDYSKVGCSISNDIK